MGANVSPPVKFLDRSSPHRKDVTPEVLLHLQSTEARARYFGVSYAAAIHLRCNTVFVARSADAVLKIFEFWKRPQVDSICGKPSGP
jgi:hypothetical protein